MNWQTVSCPASTTTTMSKKNIDILAAIAAAQNAKKPRKKPGEEEHNLQVACVNLFRSKYYRMGTLLFAVPNGGWRNAVVAGKLKAEGVTAGVSDLILLKKNSRYGALCIEMKTPKGDQSEYQEKWQKAVEDAGYKYVICRSVDEFEKVVDEYLKIK